MLQPIKLKKKIRVHIDGHGACWEPNINSKKFTSPNGIRWGMDCVEASAHEKQVMCR